MADLQYLMAWILHSLTTHQRRRGSKKKKQPDVQTALPIELLLQWLYKEQLDCKETKVWCGLVPKLQDILNWETFYTQGNNLLASSLVAMEMAFGFKLWQGEFNLEFTKTVSSGLWAMKLAQSTWWNFGLDFLMLTGGRWADTCCTKLQQFILYGRVPQSHYTSHLQGSDLCIKDWLF